MTKIEQKIPKGYWESKIGLLPIDWQIKSIEDVCTRNGIVRGPFGGTLKKEIFKKQGYKVYEQKNAIYKSTTLGDYYIDDKKYKELVRFSVKSDDFIISCSGTIGRIYKIPNDHKKGIINQALLKLTLNHLIISKYFYYEFISKKFQLRIIDDTQGGAIKNLVKIDMFKKSKLPLPSSLDEQKAIADVLTKVDESIERTQVIVEKAKLIKKGLMQDIFSQTIRFKADDGSDFPDWKEEKLGDISKISTGKKDVNEGNPNGKYPFFTCAKQCTYSNNYSFDCEAILIAGNGEVGHCKFYNGKFEAYQRTYVINHLYSSAIYIFIFLKHFFKIEVERQKQKSAMPYLKKDSLMSYIIPMPDTKERTKIVNMLTKIDENIEKYEEIKKKKQRVKKGLMQDLLTGQVRFKEFVK